LEHSVFAGADGEVTLDTQRRCLVLHDGVTPGGKPLYGLVYLNPGTAYTLQKILSRVECAGGDLESPALRVSGTAQFDSWVTCLGHIEAVAFQNIMSAVPYAASITLNLDGARLFRINQLAGDLVLSAAGGYQHGAHAVVRILGDPDVVRNLSFPGGWKWLGDGPPATIAAGKYGLLELWALVDDLQDGAMLARWSVES
jgi:hypothetical protein